MSDWIEGFRTSNGALGLLLIGLISLYTSVVIHYAKLRQSKIALITAEFAAILIMMIPSLFPFNFMRLVIAVECFVISAIVTNKVVRLWFHEAYLRAGITSDPKFERTLLSKFISISFLNINSHLTHRAPRRLPSIRHLAWLAFHTLLFDLHIFILFELIPSHSAAAAASGGGGEWRRTYAAAITVALVVNTQIHVIYILLDIILAICGAPLPHRARHDSPLLARSLAEFWGARWNPLFSRVLRGCTQARSPPPPPPRRQLPPTREASMLTD
jgi:hypothetical protein